MNKISLKKEKQLSNALYISKAIAVISIVLAHTHYNKINNDYIVSFLSIFQSVGVYIFFIIAGYFLNTEKYENIGQLLKNKLLSLGIPWIIWGSFTYVITYRTSLNFIGLIKFLVGEGSYLYFLTILTICYVIIYILRKKYKVCYYFIILSVISVLLTKFGLLSNINPYLNICNWIGVFSIGVLLKKYNILENMQEMIQKWGIIFLIIYLAYYFLLCLLKVRMEYWSLFSLINGIGSFFIVLIISLKLANCNILIDLGKKSFFIYQIHLLFLGVIFNSICEGNVVFSVLRPIITVFTIYVFILIGEKISKVVKLEKLYNTILGIR